MSEVLSTTPRLAIVCRDAGGFGGTTTTILEHARRLRERGWEVELIAERFDREAVLASGARPRRVPGWPWGSYLKRRLFAALADRRARGFDLVHGHGDNLEQDVLSLHNCVHAAHEAVHGRPLDGGSGVGRLHVRQLREGRFRLLIANSRQTQDEVVSRFGVPREKTVVIHPGFDPKRFRVEDRERFRGPVRAELRATETDVLFGLITSGDFIKRGVLDFLAAFGRLVREGARGVRAVVVGKEARLEKFRDRARAEGVAERVAFLPPSAEVERFYHALDVYVHPARYEEFGQSVQEALACGLPVVTGACVGAAELMSGSARELVLPAIETGALSAAMKALVEDPERRRRLAAAGPACVAGNTWDKNFAETFACYERLLAQKK